MKIIDFFCFFLFFLLGPKTVIPAWLSPLRIADPKRNPPFRILYGTASCQKVKKKILDYIENIFVFLLGPKTVIPAWLSPLRIPNPKRNS